MQFPRLSLKSGDSHLYQPEIQYTTPTQHHYSWLSEVPNTWMQNSEADLWICLSQNSILNSQPLFRVSSPKQIKQSVSMVIDAGQRIY